MKLDVDRYEFEYLKEWRIKGNEFDFKEFSKQDILVIAPDKEALDWLVTGFEMEFTACIDYINGTIEENWTESYPRMWKGIEVCKIGEYMVDFAISC